MKTRKLCILMVLIAGLMAGCAYSPTATRPPASQSINLYDNAGNRKAWGHLDGSGYFQLFSPSGNRLEYGRVGK